MRALFWILLLGNVILFAAMQRGGLGWGEQAYQPQPALHEEKIRLLDANQNASALTLLDLAPAVAPAGSIAQPAASASPVPSTAPVPLPKPATAAAPVPVAKPGSAAIPAQVSRTVPANNAAPAAAKQNTLICLEWGDFSGADLRRAGEVLSAMQLGEKLSQRQIEYDKGYWVYFPPQKDKAAANRKVSQIKAMGVKEYFIVQDAGALRYAISLGVFKTKDAAQNYLNELRTKGVRTARVGERASKLKTTMFMLNKVDALTEAKLAATRKDFPGIELKNVPCTLTR